jgi:hypothetical protein
MSWCATKEPKRILFEDQEVTEQASVPNVETFILQFKCEINLDIKTKVCVPCDG